MDEETDRCWAYSLTGQRCEMVAGHDDKHSVVTSWTNEECWVPGTEFLPAVEHLVHITDEELEQSLGPVPVYNDNGTPGTCLLCSHAMHNAGCPRGNCDCRAGVPAG